MPTLTDETVGEKAAAILAKRLTEAGWDVRTNRHDTQPPTFTDGQAMYCAMRQAALHADGPRSVGRPLLEVFWHDDLPTDGCVQRETRFEAQIRLGDTDCELGTKVELDTWLDALTAVAAAVDA